jgi:hypothetical protein
MTPHISVYDASAGVASSDALVASGYPDNANPGSYTIPGLGVGTYRVQFTMEATGFAPGADPTTAYVPGWYNGKYSYSTSDIVTVTTAGQTLTGIDGVIRNPRFADVSDPTSQFYTYIEWMASQGISTGTVQPSGKPLYKPVDAVSRQAMALFMYRLSGETFTPPAESTFADVAPGTQFYTAVEWMASRGISLGTPQPSGKPLFKPTDPVSRQAMAAFLYRLAHLTP